jgi:hypothetical protein
MEFHPLLQEALLWSGVLSLLAVVATLAGAPWVICRLPADYFTRERRESWRRLGGEPLIAQILALVKNAFGLLLVALGLIMLVTPGQGILTILAGLLLMNFPGKYRLERWLVSRPGVLPALDWLRERRGEPPFESPLRDAGE